MMCAGGTTWPSQMPSRNLSSARVKRKRKLSPTTLSPIPSVPGVKKGWGPPCGQLLGGVAIEQRIVEYPVDCQKIMLYSKLDCRG